MRVLFWSDLFLPYLGGPEVGARQLLPALQRRGCEIGVVTTHRDLDLPDEEIHAGIRVRRFPFQALIEQRDLEGLARLRVDIAALKRAFRPDLIHVNLIGPSLLLHLQTTRTHPAPTLVTLRRLHFPHELSPGTLLGTVLKSATWVVGCAEAVLTAAQHEVPEIVPHSSVIYNGLAMPGLTPTPLPLDPPRLLSLGRLVPNKGVDLALHAFASLVERFPDARLSVAGDGPSRGDLERLAADLGVAGAVEFKGWVKPEDVPALLNVSAVLVMPSWNEGLPVRAIEAGQMARPVVSTRVSGIPEIVRDGETGLLVEPGDSRALADAIVRLLEEPGLAQRMGEAARRRMQQRFTMERCADEYFALYRQLVQH